jgi:hypothetical protein
VTAYRRNPNEREKAHRAYHLHRVTSQFTTTISPEGARRLARLLALDDDTTESE